ncbi:symplekin-like [Schistocerca gregaria]|uniref:symplekin-like n=1 Tax=Schistocerca gregaria TaxID=7010 RepID=UPI00211F132E|nr:symplekin-like [Schistocerca gregaria]
MSFQDIEGRDDTATEEDGSSYNKIVDWLNEASVTSETTTKTEILSKVQEIIVKKEPGLLNSFLDEVIAFQSDRNSDVRRLVVGIIEEAVKKDSNVLPRVAPSLLLLLQDGSAQVQKRVVQAAAQVYRAALAWLADAHTSHEVLEATWNAITAIKAQIVYLVDCENDGIRTHAVKFLENVVLLQTYPEPDGMVRRDDFSLEDVPMTLKIARRRKLEEEALMVFELLLNFHGSPHISSVNLMTCMGSLTLIAKMRPQLFMGKVINAFEKLHQNLPPTLSKSQVSSVSKHLKIQLLNLLKQPSSVEFHNNITALLTELGATHQEVMRAFPHPEELRRRQKRVAQMAPDLTPPSSKKSRLKVEYEEEASEDDETVQVVNSEPTVEPVSTVPAPIILSEEVIDAAEKYILERLTPEVATQLVIQNMMKLPDAVPPSFCAEYKPIPNAGSPVQIKMLCRMLAQLLCDAGMDPNGGHSKQPKMEIDDGPLEKDVKPSLTSVMTEMMDKEKETQQAKASQQSGTVTVKVPKQRVRTLKLSEITKPLTTETRGNMMRAAVKRILKAERAAAVGGVMAVRSKIISTLAVTFNTDVRDVVLEFLLEDIRGRIDLAFAWLYEEYSFMQGFSRLPPFIKREEAPEHRYDKLLCSLVKSLGDRPGQEGKDGSLLFRLFLEAPLVTDEAVDILRRICGDRSRAAAGISLLQELVVRRPPRKIVFLNALLMHTAHEEPEVRTRALDAVTQLYERGELRSIIEEYAMLYLSFLRLPSPPDVLFGPDRGRQKSTIPVIECRSTTGEVAATPWSEEAVRACLYLYLALLPLNEEMIHELARVYVQTAADMKRTILRLLEQPVRGMGMDSPQLLRLVEECPKGAETLVTRVIHILTEKTPPSAELVAHVRELYHTRVSDVRFLIPVLNGLSKKEVIAALPKLIKLNPVVVKEVFNRLLGTHTESPSHMSPLTPAELLIALHSIDPSKCELKTVIKATSLCFSEKQAYSQEVLAVVLQHLMEMTPLPTLLMRTVIQSLSLYPRLIGFVMNILQRLILKQVWKQKKVWEGFIKCCQRTKPQSFQVLLQLPPAQLSDVFQVSPDLRQPLLAHVTAFTDNQRAHIPKSIMDVLLGSKRTSNDEYDVDTEARSPSDLTIDIKEEPEDYNSRSEPAPPGLE